MRIVLNPGHGGADPGAVNEELQITEHAVCVEIVKRMQAALNCDVVIQIEGLSKAIAAINKLKPSLVVSVHCNAATNKAANGAETLYYPGSAAGRMLASTIQFQLVEKLGQRNRGIQARGDLGLLRSTSCPAVIVEPFFISNSEEYKRMNLLQVADAITRGIQGFLACPPHSYQ